jgi:uncharacterized protein with HEPN domain
MQQRDPRAFLWDMRDAGKSVVTFVADITFDRYLTNELVRSAVERKLQIIGEALSQLSHVDPVLAARVPDKRSLVAFRNVLVHRYALLDHVQVWQAIQNDLPPLLLALNDLLTELGPEPDA